MLPLPTPRPLLIAVAASLALPAGAHAAGETVYAVTLEGNGSFSQQQHVSDVLGDWTQRTTFEVGVKATFPEVTFRDGRLTETVEVGGIQTVTGQTRITTTDVDGTRTAQCTAAQVAENGRAVLKPDPDGSERLLVRGTDGLMPAWQCTGDLALEPGSWDTTSIIGDPGDGPLDAAFMLPREAIGKGKIIQLIDGPPKNADQRCPGQDARTTTCTGSWHGQLTFTKVTLPRPTHDVSDVSDVSDVFVAIMPRRATVSGNGATVAFKAGCARGCAGTARLTAGARPRAKLRFKVKAGGPRTIRLRLPARARRALRRAGRGTLTVTLRPSKGRARTVRLAVTLRPRA